MADDDYGEDDFPVGDGTVASEAEVICPYCGEEVVIAIDAGSGSEQNYVEDCPVCCKPWQVTVKFDDEGQAEVSLVAEDETG